MGKASISIAITGSYNGAAVDRARSSIERLSTQCVTASSGASSLSRDLVESGARWADAGGRIYNTGEKVESAGTKLLGVSAAMTGVAVASGRAAIDIDTALTGVRKTVDGTEEQYRALKESAIEFSKTNAVSAAQIIDIQALGAQLGFSIDELDEFGRVVSGLDIATDMGAEQAATEMAQFANITRMAHTDVSNYGSAIVNLGNHMATTESSISSMSMRVAAASTQVGMSQAEILGWSAAMSSLGVEAEAGGTAFSQTVATIDAAVASGSDSVNAFAEIAGMSAEQFSESWKRSASDTMVALLQGTDGAENMTIALENMGVTGIRQTDVLKRLAGNTDLVTQALGYANQGWRENTALQDEVDNRNESMAAKLEILQNKLTAIAEDVGTPLVEAATDAIDAAEPLIQGVESLTQAFADMDEEGQRNVLMLAGLAAGAGPVLVATGKVIKGVGNVATSVGRAKQLFGTYADALTTTNAKSLDTYSSNKRLASALKNNGAVQAAGSVEAYTEAVKNANKSNANLTSAEKSLARERSKGTRASQERIAALSGEVDRLHEVNSRNQATVQGYKSAASACGANTAAVKASAVAHTALSSAASVAKTALAAVGPALAIAAVTAFVSKVAEAKEHSDNLSKATDGLVSASSGLSDSAAGAAESVGGEASAIERLFQGVPNATKAVDDMLSAQAKLADTIKSTNTGAAAQSAQLQDAYSTIRQYAGQSDLSADAQSRLRAAVQTVNDMCGTQIEVTDSVNGVLSDENGVIEDVSSALDGYVQKKLAQIRVDAQQQNLTALYAQQATDIETVAKAQQAYNEQIKTTMDAVPGMTRETAVALNQNSEAAKNLSEAQSALDAVNSSINNVSSSLGAATIAAQGGSAGIQTVATASAAVSAAANATDKDINKFAQSVADAGVSVADFSSLSASQLAELVASWDGSATSIVDTMSRMGAGMTDAGQSAVSALAAGMESGRVSVESATQALQQAATGDWSGVVATMRQAGVDVPEAVAQGVTDASFQASSATSAMLSAVALTLTGGDVQAAAQLLGHDIDEGLAAAIRDNDTAAIEAVGGLSQEVIEKARETFETHSPSRVFYEIGQNDDQGLADGIEGNAAGPLGAIGSLVTSIVGATDGLPGDMRTRGSQASQSLSSGLSSGSGAVGSSARSLDSSARQAVSGLASSMGQTGSRASRGFAAGIGSAQGQAYSAGQSMAWAARSMANDSGSAYTWGSHLASNFASGISAGIGWVASAAANIAARARSILGFSVPEDGPWSGAEKGGETSGLHLAQNFASGMEKGRSVVQAAADGLASAARPTTAVQAPTGADRYPEGLELLREAVNLLSAIASRDEGVYMDADKVSAALTRRARSTAAGRGCRI